VPISSARGCSSCIVAQRTQRRKRRPTQVWKFGHVSVHQSMSLKDDYWDNAPMESFFHTLKTELIMCCDYKIRDQARASIFDYMEVFYNH